MYGNTYRRPCKFGPDCRYLRNGTCWYYHPDWHEDVAEQRTYENYTSYNSITSLLEKQRRLMLEKQKKEEEEERERQRQRQRQRQRERERERRRQMERIRQREEEKKIEQLMLILALSRKKEEEQTKPKILNQKKEIKVNGKKIQGLKINSNLRASKKWFFQNSNHFHYFEGCEHDACPICLSKFEKQDVISLLFCNHAFHNDCIEKWLQKSEKCPMCRQSFDKHEAFKTMEGYQKPGISSNELLLMRFLSLRNFL